MACVNIKNFTATKYSNLFFPPHFQKTKAPLNPCRFGGWFNTCHCYCNAFPTKCRLILLSDELMNNRYLVDTGAKLSIVPCTSNAGPFGSLLKGADGQPIPSWGFRFQKRPVSGQAFYRKFCASYSARFYSGHWFLEWNKWIFERRWNPSWHNFKKFS